MISGADDYLVFAEEVSSQLSSNNEGEVANVVDLRKIDDGSVVSNEHTSKWRIFTDTARDFFMQARKLIVERGAGYFCLLYSLHMSFMN